MTDTQAPSTWLAFTTTRFYGPTPQLIECALVERVSTPRFDDAPELGDIHIDTVVFKDYARGLNYQIKITGGMTEDNVMRAYDANDGTDYVTLENQVKFDAIKALNT